MSATLPVILLAAGANSRFFPFNTSVHKSGISICGQPVIARTLQSLQAHGFMNVIIVLSPEEPFHSELKKIVEQAGFTGTVEYISQPTPVGAGDAILRCKEVIPDRFAVINSTAIDAGKILSQMEAAQAAVCYTNTDEPWLYGILSLDSHGQATKIVEKPAPGSEESSHKVEGLYILEHAFLDILEQQPVSEYSFEAALDQQMQKSPLPAVELTEKLASSLKYPWHILEVMKDVVGTLPSFRHPSVQVAATAVIDESKGAVYLDEGGRIGDFVKIVGPCYIGKNVLIGDYSFLRESSIEAGTVVGANTEVVRSHLFERVSIHYSYLADSILGKGTRVGAGLVVGNKRIDRNNITVKVKGQPIDTRRNNLGLITGEDCTIGIQVASMPGTMIGAKTQIWPTTLLYSVHPNASIIKPTHSSS